MKRFKRVSCRRLKIAFPNGLQAYVYIVYHVEIVDSFYGFDVNLFYENFTMNFVMYREYALNHRIIIMAIQGSGGVHCRSRSKGDFFGFYFYCSVISYITHRALCRIRFYIFERFMVSKKEIMYIFFHYYRS